MKNKKKWIIVVCIVVLVLVVAVFAILNAGNLEDKKESQEKAEVTITRNDEQVAVFTLEKLEKYEKTVFNANLDKSGEEAVEKSFGGVFLNDVLTDLQISLNGDEHVIFVAADGYTTAITATEVLEADNIYLVYERDGEPTGTKASGGSGPIEIVIAKDDFSQRWCKFLMEIQINEGA